MSVSNFLKAELKGDKVIWAILSVLALFSVLAVYSSSSTMALRARGDNSEFYLIKQILVLGLGLFITYICFLIHYKRYSAMAPYALLGTIVLLAITLAIGPDVNDARRWLVMPGIGITFQTSDLAKIALIAYVARSITAKQGYITDLKNAFLPIILPIIIVFLLIAPADLSTAVVLFITCFLMMFIGRVAMKYILLLILCGVMAFACLIILGDKFKGTVRTDTWKERIRSFSSDSEGSTQTQLAKMAIARGGVFGTGPGNSVQKNYLPMAYTDYIYAVILEEYGLIGGTLLLALYVLLFLRVVRLVTISPKTFPAMLSIGLALILTIQALLNMAVSVHLIPVAGLPLPFVSMGGTSLLFSCVSIGMILSVSKFIESK